MKDKFRYVVAACARWESANIAEWILYHIEIGFDHFYIYCNDDNPMEMYEVLLPFISGGVVTFHHFGVQGQQEAMLTHYLITYVNDCEWFLLTDLDEFLVLRSDEKIGEFLDGFPYLVDAIHFNQVDAGNNGHVNRPSGSAILNFTRRSRHPSGFTKCIARRSSLNPETLISPTKGAWNHNISVILKQDARVVNVLGQDMRDYYKDITKNWIDMRSDDFSEKIIGTAFVYHMSMKSEADFLRRVARGVKGQYYGQQNWQLVAESGREGMDAFFNPRNEVYEERLLCIREKMLLKAFSGQIGKTAPGKNIAPTGFATQSSTAMSTSRFPNDMAKDAAGVIDGEPDGLHSHHTETEDEPWWQVAFEKAVTIHEIRVFNRVDASRNRFRNFRLIGSQDGEKWSLIFDKNDDLPFGGVDGHFFAWRSEDGFQISMLRVVGRPHSHLDLDQVEMFSS